MKEFINNYYKTRKLELNDLNKFIIEYCELKEVKNTTVELLQWGVQFLQTGTFSLDYALREYCRLKEYQIIDLYDKNNQLIQTKIN